MVNAAAIIAATGMPKSKLYRLVEQGKVRAYPLPRLPHHQRQAYLFKLSEVEEDLANLPRSKAMRESRPPYGV